MPIRADRETADVCVIGSGAGGAPVAHILARAGFRVVVLEKGPRHDPKDFRPDEIAVVRRDFFVPDPRRDPHILVEEGTKKPHRTSFGWIGSCVGGGTVHMAGYFYRLHPVDFRMGSTFGTSKEIPLADWPISYDDLEPYYSRVEREIGVSGLAGANRYEPPRSAPYPLGPVRTHPAANLLDRACRRLNLNAFPSPRAVLSAPYRQRPGCVYCDFCGSYGCEVGAKSSTLATLLPAAERTGRCRIVPEASVFRIEIGQEGRVTGCLYHDSNGIVHRIRARTVVVACSSIETARLLLLSTGPGFSSGLANSSGLVGRNLQFSVFNAGTGVFHLNRLSRRTRELLTTGREPFLGRSVQDFYRLPPEVSEIDKGGTLRFGFPHANPIFRALQLAHRGGGPPRWGATLQRRIQEAWHETRTFEFETFADFLPSPGTRVSLDPTTTDRNGIPSARIDLAIPEHHLKAGRFLTDRGLEILDTAGAHETEATAVGQTTGHLVHGTCRAGTDPTTSVLDPDGRAHDIPNLYVTDGSYFPSAGGVPTTLTILANATRIADRIVERTRRGELR